MEARELVKLIVDTLEDKKAEDIKTIDIREISTLTDYFIFTHGNSRNQVKAMVDHVEEACTKAGIKPKYIEGYDGGTWVLMDYIDVVVQIFTKEEREYYDVERIWRDGKLLTNLD